jgi:DNA mismatch endonuclease (patch repair protein)
VADVHNSEQRSRNMAAIRGKNTKPELKVRSALHARGYRFRIHQKRFPGNPDIVLPKHRTVIFVHGCFWHCHACRYGKVTPATHANFWLEKRAKNVERDRKNAAAVRSLGWNVLTLWECQTRDADVLTSALDHIFPNLN